VSRSTTGRVAKELTNIGAAKWTTGTKEFTLCSPFRALDVYKVTWDRSRNFLGRVTESDAKDMVENGKAVWGGCRAAVEHMDGFAPAMPYPSSVYVLDTNVNIQEDGTVDVYRWVTDTLPEGNVSTVTQTLTELFNTPGWVFSDFYQALWDRRVREIR
jgi:hypothetical protein